MLMFMLNLIKISLDQHNVTQVVYSSII